MWHASISGYGRSVDTLRAKALSVLAGVGDAALGQWEEPGDMALHLRRRLTAAEAARVGPIVDVRGTPEGLKRFEQMRRYVPAGWTDVV